MNGAKSLKAELRELKKQIASGNYSGKELQQMTKRAAELTDHLGDVNEKIKALSSDTKRIDAMVGAMKGVAAAASIAAGATALFGTENKKMAEAAQKAQSAMALLAGVQEIAALATSESAAKTLFLDGAQKLATVSSRVLGVTITTSMAAATMGLSLVIAAIAAMVVSMQDAEKEGSRITATQADRNKNLEQASLDHIENTIKAKKDGLEKELELQAYYDANARAEIRKKKQNAEIDDNTAKLLLQDQELKHQQNLKEIRQKYADEEKKIREKAKADADKIAKEEAAAFKARQEKYAELMQKMREIDNERTEESINNRKKEQKAAEDAILAKMNAQLAANQKEIDDYWRKKQEEIDAENKAAQKRKELTQFTIDQARVVADTVFTIMQQNRQAIFDADMAALKEARERELDNKNLTESQRAQIEKRYKLEEARLKQQAWKQQRDADLAQAVINGALAISRAWTLGLPAAIPASIAAGVATAAQIAVIANTKPPKFADGTEFLIGA